MQGQFASNACTQMPPATSFWHHFLTAADHLTTFDPAKQLQINLAHSRLALQQQPNTNGSRLSSLAFDQHLSPSQQRQSEHRREIVNNHALQQQDGRLVQVSAAGLSGQTPKSNSLRPEHECNASRVQPQAAMPHGNESSRNHAQETDSAAATNDNFCKVTVPFRLPVQAPPLVPRLPKQTLRF